MKKESRTVKDIFKVVAIVGASVWADKMLEAKTYDAELTQSVAQILDARYGNDTTEIGRKWRIISAKENITANDVYEFLNKHWQAYEAVNDVCPPCILELAELIRKQNLGSCKEGSGNGGGVKPSGPGIQPQPQSTLTEISKEAKSFFSKTIEVEGKKMSALEYLIACGYLPGEIEAVYEKIKKDWGKETPKLSPEFLDAYAQEVTGKVLPYPGEQKPELTQAQIDSLRSWALDTLDAAFERSLGAAKKQWDNYNKWGDKSLDGIYRFCLDVRSLVKEGTRESKAIEAVIGVLWPYTKENKELEEEMKRKD